MRIALLLLTIAAFVTLPTEPAMAKNYGYNSKSIIVESKSQLSKRVPMVKISEEVLMELPDAAEIYIRKMPKNQQNTDYSAQHTVYLY